MASAEEEGLDLRKQLEKLGYVSPPAWYSSAVVEPEPAAVVKFPHEWAKNLDNLVSKMGVANRKEAVATAIAALSQEGVVGNTLYVEIDGRKKVLPLWKAPS